MNTVRLMSPAHEIDPVMLGATMKESVFLVIMVVTMVTVLTLETATILTHQTTTPVLKEQSLVELEVVPWEEPLQPKRIGSGPFPRV